MEPLEDSGIVVFITKKSKSSTTLDGVTKRLSDTLGILGIERYILLLDSFVQELLGPKTTTVKSSVQFPILEPLTCSNWKHRYRRRSIADHEEREVKHSVLHAHIKKVCEKHGQQSPWVLLVEYSETRFDHAGLQELSEKFSFSVHWFGLTDSKTKTHSKFQSIIAQVLQLKNSTQISKNQQCLETVHKNKEPFDSLNSGQTSRCDLDSRFDVTLTPPPRFREDNDNDGAKYKSSASYTSFPESEDERAAESEIDFDNEVLEAALDFSKRLPVPSLKRYMDIANRNPSNNIRQSFPVFVALVRDLSSGRTSHLSLLLKRTLQRKGIKCQRLVVSTLFIQAKAIEIMKHFGATGGGSVGADLKTALGSGCFFLVLNVLHFKLSEEHRCPLVIIFDLEDEKYVRLHKVLDFCEKVGQKVVVLEKRFDGSFEQSFRTTCSKIQRECCCRRGSRKRIRKLKLPKFNFAFIKEFLPANSNVKFYLTHDEPRVEERTNACGSDLSHVMEARSSLASEVSVDINNNRRNRVHQNENSAKTLGRRLVSFIFERKASKTVTKTTPSPACNVGHEVKESFGVEELKSIFSRGNKMAPKNLVVHAIQAGGSQTFQSELQTRSLATDSAGLQGSLSPKPKPNDPKPPESKIPEKLPGLDENMNEIRDTPGFKIMSIVSTSSTESSISDEYKIPTKPKEVTAITQDVHVQVQITKIENTSEEKTSSKEIENRLTIEGLSALPIPIVAQTWNDIEDYVPGRTQGLSAAAAAAVVDSSDRKVSLIQICRLPPRKRRRVDAGSNSSDDASLFKGWVGIPRQVISKKQKDGIILRIYTWCQNFICGPIRNAFRKSSRGNNAKVTPSQLIRRNWTHSGEPPRGIVRRRRNSDMVTATTNPGENMTISQRRSR